MVATLDPNLQLTYPGAASQAYAFGTFLAPSDPIGTDAFFDDAAFIGDSRTEGFQYWSGIKNGTCLWKRGLSVYTVNDKRFTWDFNGSSYTLYNLLAQRQFGKVYLMLGINELGSNSATYEQRLSQLVDRILETQPNAVLYMLTMPPLNDQKARANLGAKFNNTNLNTFNEAIIRVATEKKAVLLNLAEVYRDENGQLPYNLASDGCHFISSAYARWGEYLRTHYIDPAVYFACRNGTMAVEPSEAPTDVPTEAPTGEPTEAPVETPAAEPTEVPVETPAGEPTEVPSTEPSTEPSAAPTETPTEVPSTEPAPAPSEPAAPTEVPVETPPAEVPVETPPAEPSEEPPVPTEEPVPTPESPAETTETPVETAPPAEGEAPTEPAPPATEEVPTQEPSPAPVDPPAPTDNPDPSDEPLPDAGEIVPPSPSLV